MTHGFAAQQQQMILPSALPGSQWVMLSSATMLLSSDNTVFKDLWSRSTHIKKRNLHKYSRTVSEESGLLTEVTAAAGELECVRDLFWKTAAAVIGGD